MKWSVLCSRWNVCYRKSKWKVTMQWQWAEHIILWVVSFLCVSLEHSMVLSCCVCNCQLKWWLSRDNSRDSPYMYSWSNNPKLIKYFQKTFYSSQLTFNVFLSYWMLSHLWHSLFLLFERSHLSFHPIPPSFLLSMSPESHVSHSYILIRFLELVGAQKSVLLDRVNQVLKWWSTFTWEEEKTDSL